ncbi:DUF6053 domain-containing protein [Lysobacter enzymogenes]|uniref:DUF6053 domain-containing protein n=1 Tax=Lysobacter enzymogenes TaxID=69 RepID=UPI003396D960
MEPGRARRRRLIHTPGAGGRCAGTAVAGGTSVPMLSAQIAATRHKSLGTEVPPTTAARRGGSGVQPPGMPRRPICATMRPTRTAP